MLKLAFILSILVANAELRWLDRFIQPRPYSQCGGADWTGSTTCPQGFYCFYQNQWFNIIYEFISWEIIIFTF